MLYDVSRAGPRRPMLDPPVCSRAARRPSAYVVRVGRDADASAASRGGTPRSSAGSRRDGYRTGNHVTPKLAGFADREVAVRFVLDRCVIPDEDVVWAPRVGVSRRRALDMILQPAQKGPAVGFGHSFDMCGPVEVDVERGCPGDRMSRARWDVRRRRAVRTALRRTLVAGTPRGCCRCSRRVSRAVRSSAPVRGDGMPRACR